MTPTDFAQFQADSFKAANAFFTTGVEGFQKLTELNTRIAKSALEQSADQMKNLMAAKDAKSLNEAITNNAQPGQAMSGYAKEVFEIAAQTNAEVIELIEDQVAEGNKQVDAMIEAIAKNAPTGSEGAISMLKQSVSASRSAYEQAAKAGKQMAQNAQANVAAATKPAKKGK